MTTFVIQTRKFSNTTGKPTGWQNARFVRETFKSEDAAWTHIATYDEDGIADRHNYRVVESAR